jgi:pimeloyl-ACP methyl ester carboxylesterase
VLEAGLRLGSGDGVVQRVLRAAAAEDPSLEPYRSWLAAEFRRGDVAGIVAAGRALRDYDARAWASTIRVPVAVVVTTADRLVPPRKQRDLASVLGAMVFEQVGDHDSPITRGTAFGTVTRAAVDHVAARATTSTTTTTKSTATPASKRVSAGRRRRAAES